MNNILLLINKYIFTKLAPRPIQSSSLILCGVHIVYVPSSSNFFSKIFLSQPVPLSLPPSLSLAKTGNMTKWSGDLWWPTQDILTTCDIWHIIPPSKSVSKSWNLSTNKQKSRVREARNLSMCADSHIYFCFVLNRCHVSCVMCHVSPVTSYKL